MRKFKPATPLKISDKLRNIARSVSASHPQTEARPAPPPEEDFEATMEKAFPAHLRGTISGCCDSMEDGHG